MGYSAENLKTAYEGAQTQVAFEAILNNQRQEFKDAFSEFDLARHMIQGDFRDLKEMGYELDEPKIGLLVADYEDKYTEVERDSLKRGLDIWLKTGERKPEEVDDLIFFHKNVIFPVTERYGLTTEEEFSIKETAQN